MKKITMTLIAGGLLLASCSESESENFTSANTPIELSTIDELKQFTCDESLNGIEVFVEEKDASFVCDQEENGTWGWTRSKSSGRENASSKSSSSSDYDTESSDAGNRRSSSSISPSSSEISNTSNLPSSSSYVSPYVKPEAVRFGLFTDPRDKQVYKTVTIGTQTWMAQNLNYTPPTVFYNQTDIVQYNNWCGGKEVQGREHGDCAVFGKLYTYAAAMDSAGQAQRDGRFCDEGWGRCSKQGICPDGWHIPDKKEWETLALAASIDGSTDGLSDSYRYAPRNLFADSVMWKSVSRYGGYAPFENLFKFNALPSGLIMDGIIISTLAEYWASDDSDGIMEMNSLHAGMNRYSDRSFQQSLSLAIRCIKDSIETDSANLSETVIEPPDYTIDLGPTIIEPGEPRAAITYLNPDIEYGEMTDSRDGQVYKTFTFNNQTWMAQNLNYKYNPGVQSWCGGGYEHKEGDCDTYGRLYTWAATKGHSESECGYSRYCRDSTLQGICPDGWYVPSLDQYDTLYHYLVDTRNLPAGPLLKANSDLWNENGKGLDAIGFSALPAGLLSSTFIRTTEEASFWTRDQNSEFAAKSVALRAQFDRIDTSHYEHKDEARSVRCIKY